MDDKDYIERLVLYLIGNEAEESEAAGSSRNFRSDEDGHKHPETELREIQVNSSIESDRSFSASSFSRETGVASSLPTPLSIQGFGSSFDISTSDLLFGAQQSISEATGVNPANSFLAPLETARGDFCRTDDSQSNPSEHSSSQHNIEWTNRGQVPQKSLGAYDNNCKKRENNPEEFFPRKKLTRSDSAWPPQTSKERDVNEALAQTAEYYRELSIASSIFSPVNISSVEIATDRASLGSVAGAEAVSAGGPSGIQTRSDQTAKDKPFKCGICGKTFGRKYTLRRHENAHTGHKSFVCSTCGKRFGRKSHLLSHLLVHSGEKPHECTECHQRFRMKHHLTVHLRTHTKEKETLHL